MSELVLPDPGTANRRHFLSTVLPELAFPPGSRVTELGCGDGYYCSVFSELARARHGAIPFDYLGIDLDADAVAKAAVAFPDAEFRVGDVTAPDALAGRPFGNLALCCETLSIVPDFTAVVDRLLGTTVGTLALDLLVRTDGVARDVTAPLLPWPPFEYQMRSARTVFRGFQSVLADHPGFWLRHASHWAFSPAALEEFTGRPGPPLLNLWLVFSNV